ncbi:MAG: class I SAM-dependent methyltransferase [Candidatus Thorarchaeota archaeon]|jgi:ubiquinone/menaquinone biosynthesis C-methylase UbiE
MYSTIKAWKEILKLGGRARTRGNQVRDFYKANSINVLRKEGWFDYMAYPRTLEDVAGHFGYTDLDFLRRYLEAYSDDEILIKEDGTYRTNGPVEEYSIEIFDLVGPGLVQLAADAAARIPDRLKGRFVSFSDQMDTFNWDDALQLKLYEQMRKAAFEYSNASKRRGNFIDVGCGSGVGTAAIWGYYYKAGAFKSDNPVKIYALEYDANLLQIAEEEFSQYASRLLGVDRNVIESMKEHHPVYVHGSAEDLPFEEDFFDMVYASQVIHWCNAEKATKDMMRVLKPGGVFFGTEAFSPMLDSYVELYILLNEGAYGSVKKEDFLRWVQEAGATQVDTATPATVFRVVK